MSERAGRERAPEIVEVSEWSKPGLALLWETRPHLGAEALHAAGPRSVVGRKLLERREAAAAGQVDLGLDIAVNLADRVLLDGLLPLGLLRQLSKVDSRDSERIVRELILHVGVVVMRVCMRARNKRACV